MTRERSLSVAKMTFAGALLFSLVFAGTSARAQAVFQSAASAGWNSASTWTLVSGSDADGIPDTNDVVTIRSGDSVTTGNTSRNCASLTIQSGGVLHLSGNGNVIVNAVGGGAVVNGVLRQSGNGYLQRVSAGSHPLTVGSGARITITGAAPFPLFDSYSLDANSTVEFTRNGDQTIRSGIVFGNLVVGGSGEKQVSPIPSDTTFRALGTVTVGGSYATLDVSTCVLHLYFDGNVFVNATDTLDASVGVVVTVFSGSQFVNNGTFLTSDTSFYGYTPSVTYNGTTVSGSSPQSYSDLVISGTFTPSATVTVIRHLTITSSGIFNAGNGLTHSVGGNWTNNGTFNCGTSTVTLHGPDTARQNVGASTFYNLVVNNPRGAALTGNVTVDAGGSVTLTRGSVATGTYSLTINNPSPSALTLDTNKISGSVVRAIQSGSGATYLFLSANAFVIPSGTGYPSFISMTEHPGSNPPNLSPAADTTKTAKRYYTFAFTGEGSGFTSTVRLPYLQSEVRGLENDYKVWSYGISGWRDRGIAALDPTANYVQQAGLDGYTTLAIAESGAALPIQLASFTAATVPQSSNVLLSWVTLSETNNYGFYIEQSIGSPDNFVEVPGVFLSGRGTIVERTSYTWTAENLSPGVFYFRLRQVDLDGTPHLSDAVKVVVGGATGVGDPRMPLVFELRQNYPNPFNPTTRIQFTVEKQGQAKLQVYNVLGQQVATLFEGEAQPGQVYTVTFDGAQLTDGAYFARLSNGERSSIKKMMLLK